MSATSGWFVRFMHTKRLFFSRFVVSQFRHYTGTKAQAGRLLVWSSLRRIPLFLSPPLFISSGWFGISFGGDEAYKASGDSAAMSDDLQKLTDNVDELYAANKNSEIIALLKPRAGEKSDAILWRLARSTYNLGQAAESAKMKDLYFEAFDYAKEALELNDQNFACHKWYAILLDLVGSYEGTKKRIENAYIVKEHFEKATQLNPNDATSSHTLGFWHFLFADMPWYQRTVASAIFASPPSSTYDEALKFFLKAEDQEPGFYAMNVLMIGKSYTRMKKKEEAISYLKKVLEFPMVTEDDKKAHEEAKQLLKGHGVKT